MYWFLLSSLLSIQPTPRFIESYLIYSTSGSRISFHYKYNGDRIKNLENLAKLDTSIKFAMNACMFTSDYRPVGLYIEKGQLVSKTVILHNSKVNFGISPAVFFIDKKGKAGIVDVGKAKPADYYYAVQIAPMLVINGDINPRVKGMKSRFIRNGFGITKEGKIIMMISLHSVTMEQFASKFKALGCIAAAYIDGAVSESWQKNEVHPEIPGEFGPMVAAH